MEFVAHEIQRWLSQASVRTFYINKASPWEKGYVESFNGKLSGELLNRELFLGFDEARYVLDEWRLTYNHRRPRSGIYWQSPASYAASLPESAEGGRRLCLLLLRSGLRRSLRVSRQTKTRFSHIDWYKNWEGITLGQEVADTSMRS